MSFGSISEGKGVDYNYNKEKDIQNEGQRAVPRYETIKNAVPETMASLRPGVLVEYDAAADKYKDNTNLWFSKQWLLINNYGHLIRYYEQNLEEQKIKDKTTRDILNERGNTHGKWADNAQASAAMFEIWLRIATRAGKKNLPPEIVEGVRMVLHKLGRAAAGDIMELDHYLDGQGYLQLVQDYIKSQRIEKENFGHSRSV